MDEAKAKFVLDWETVFPGVPIPNLSILAASSESVDHEISKRLKVVQNLKFVLAQEEFLVEKLKGFKDVYSSLQNNNDDKSKDNVIEENEKPREDIIPSNDNIVVDKEKPEYKAIWDAVPKSVSVSEPDNEATKPNTSNTENNHAHGDMHKPIWESVPKPMKKLPSFGDEDLPPPPTPDETNISVDSPVSTMDVHVEQGATFNIEVLKSNTESIPIQRDIVRHGSRNSLSTFQSNSVGQSDNEQSSSQSSLNAMFLSESAYPDDDSVIIEPLDNFANIKTHRKSYSIDENVFDYSSPIPVARRLTDPLPNSQSRKEEKPKPKVAPRTMSRSKQHKPLPPLPKKPERTSSVETDLNLIKNNKPHSEPPKCPPPALQQRSISEASSSAYQDDEHIYTDISSLNINRSQSPEAHESDSDDNSGSPIEQIYENSNMQPKIEPLVDNSYSKPQSLEEQPRVQYRKRLGSHDRQGMALPDDVDLNKGAIAGGASSLEEVLIGAQESSVDDNITSEYVNNKPLITVNSQYDSDSDDDEHIYANVDDLNLYSKSDDDSDHDHLGDSISLGIPSPHYTELTSEQIQSMLHKIQNNTSDHSQGIYNYIHFLLKKTKRKSCNVVMLQDLLE